MSFVSVAPISAAILAARRDRAARVPGQAAERLAALGDRALVLDLYDDGGADQYHAIAREDRSEIREVLSAVRSHPGRVLELAAGAGRLTLPLLAAGREVTAVDLSDPMLTILRAELDQLPRDRAKKCRVVRADMTSFRVRRGKFSVAVLGTSSVSLLDEKAREQMFGRTHRHLSQDGGFILTTVVAPADEDGSSTEPEIVTPLPNGGTVHEYWEPGANQRHLTLFAPEVEGEPVAVYTSIVRVVPVETLTAELEAAGFTISRVLPVQAEPGRHALQLIEAVRQ